MSNLNPSLINQSTAYKNGNHLVKWLAWGMLFSDLGDGFLVYKASFEIGILAFAVAQICFIKAFTFQPLKLVTGIVFYILEALLLG